MSMADDDRWERFLYCLNYLSQMNYSGRLIFNFSSGRIAGSTMRGLNDEVKRVQELNKEEAVNA